MLLLCEVCGEDELENGPCQKCAHIKDKFIKLKDENRILESRLNRIRDNILFYLVSLKNYVAEAEAAGRETVEIPLDKVLAAWNEGEIKGFYEANNARSFLSRELAVGLVIIRAHDLFRTYNRPNAELRDKLQSLLEAIIKEVEICGYHDVGINLTPDDIIKAAKGEA
jgi:hypothetical protein